MKYIDKLLKSWKTVFNFTELSMLFNILNKNTIKNIISRMKKNNILKSISYWIYALPNYDNLEFISKLRSNSYISLETVLQKEWVIFQDYSSTYFLISNNTFTKKKWDIIIEFHKIKDKILHSPIWIIYNGKYMIASKERAICDRIYLSPYYYFDNLDDLNIDLLSKLKEIYPKTTALYIQKIIDDQR